MEFCYLDESGNTGRRLDDPGQPVHLIAAVLVREDRVRIMAQQLDALARSAPTIVPLIEYHGNELFGGTGAWKGVLPRQRIGEYAKALRVLEAVDATVIHASIDKPNLAELEYQDPNPHLIALQFLTEKLERWMRGRQHELSQTVLLVADENHEQEQFSIDLIHQMQASGGPIGEWTSLAIPLDHFVDSVYFAQSNQNRGIQLADLVAFPLNRQQWIRRYSGKRRSDRAVDRLVKDHIDPRVHTFRQRWPPTARNINEGPPGEPS